ncbi:MAG: PKD domain-containing protein [bacterium]
MLRRRAILAAVIPTFLMPLILTCADDGPTFPNLPPTASFTVTPSSGTTQTLFEFDASASVDPNGAEADLEFRWDWDGDDGWDTQWSAAKVASHRYNDPGTKTVRLAARDPGQLIGYASKAVTVIQANTAPVARFTFSPDQGTAATEFEFDASGSSDDLDPPDSLEVRWDWNGDLSWDTGWTTTKIAHHQFNEFGMISVSLEARDTGDLVGRATREVVVNNPPPVASFEVAPLVGDADTEFSFDASACSDFDDSAAVLEVRWNWENDLIWDTQWSRTKTATHKYTSIGLKTIALVVRDTGGKTAQTTRTVNVVSGTTPPVAFFTVSPESGLADTVFRFDASGSSDVDDAAALLEVRWDWQDDGTWDTGWSTAKTASHQYSSAGLKTVRLRVRDLDSMTGDTTQTVNVLATGKPPHASFSVNPAVGVAGRVFDFDANNSSDPEGWLDALRWDWEDDGTWDTEWSHVKFATHIYPTPGTMTVRLIVRDYEGLTDDTTGTVTVVVTTNAPPVAVFAMNPASGTPETIFSFNASDSHDAEDPTAALKVRWDFEDDGTWDTDWTTDKWDHHSYSTTGTWTVRLRVKDVGGLTDDATKSVRILASNSPPTAVFTVDPTSGDLETVFAFDASTSSDAEYADSELVVAWDWTSDGRWDTGWLTERTATHQYTLSGVKTVKLQVKDPGGLTANATTTVAVQGPNTPPQAKFSVFPGPGTTNTHFRFDAGSSTDAEDVSSELQVRWDFESDGIWDTDWSHTKAVYHQFAAAGNVPVGLEVKDTFGLTDTTTRTVEVAEGPVPGTLVPVPAGSFDMGGYTHPYGNCNDVHAVTLTHSFYIGQCEVTNQEYRDAVQWAYDHGYVTATATSVADALDGSTVELVDLDGGDLGAQCPLAFSGGTFAVRNPGKEDHPMAMVSWFGAAAYCDWLSMQQGLPRSYDHATWQCNGGDPYGAAGYRLPTDAEWEFAAQYDDERIYPWGNGEPSLSLANYSGSGDIVGTCPVGSYPGAPSIGGYLLFDMAGNVAEWCNDYFNCQLGSGAVTDPVGPLSAPEHVMRNGHHAMLDFALGCAFRGLSGNDDYFCTNGFRIARTQ